MIKRITNWLLNSKIANGFGPVHKNCFICGASLQREDCTKNEPLYETLCLECPKKHYRVLYRDRDWSFMDASERIATKRIWKIESDYADAEDFCVRRFFILGFTDVIPVEHLVFTSKYLRITINEVVNNEEIRKLVIKYKQNKSIKKLRVML